MSLDVAPGALAANLPTILAAVIQLPTGAGIVPTDRLAVHKQCRNGFAELPRELSVRVSLAVVDLCAHGMERHDKRVACDRNRIGQSSARQRRRWQR